MRNVSFIDRKRVKVQSIKETDNAVRDYVDEMLDLKESDL